MTQIEIPLPEPTTAIEYYVDALEIAVMIGLHHRTVQQMARDGDIPAHPLGEGERKTWRFLRSEVREWMQRKVNSECHPCCSNRRKPN